MIPKSKRRVIVVDGAEWEYCISGVDCITIFLHNMTTNEKISWHTESGGRATPKDIRTLIETKQLDGIKAI